MKADEGRRTGVSSDAFFYSRTSGSERYAASLATTGPWDPRLQHGGPVAALLASRIERLASDPSAPPGARRVGHVSLDFLGPVPVAPLDLTTECIRPGKKVSLWESRAAASGREVARVRAWVLQTEDARAPAIHLEDDTARPLTVEPATTYFENVPRFPYGDALEWRFIEGSFAEAGPATLWARLRVGIVEGEPVTALSSLLAMVDSANGVSAELDVRTHLFVPVNLTVSVARHPASEWVGMGAISQIATDGVGVTRARLFDEKGALGHSLQTLYVERR